MCLNTVHTSSPLLSVLSTVTLIPSFITSIWNSAQSLHHSSKLQALCLLPVLHPISTFPPSVVFKVFHKTAYFAWLISHPSFFAWSSYRSMESFPREHMNVPTSGPLLMLVPLPRMPFSISLPEEFLLIFQGPVLLGRLLQEPQKETVMQLLPPPSSLSSLLISWYLAHYLLIFIYLSLPLLINSSEMQCHSTSRHPWIPHAYLNIHTRCRKVCWPATKALLGIAQTSRGLGSYRLRQFTRYMLVRAMDS